MKYVIDRTQIKTDRFVIDADSEEKAIYAVKYTSERYEHTEESDDYEYEVVPPEVEDDDDESEEISHDTQE